jgi:two-component system, NtrC family, response regulator HydG
MTPAHEPTILLVDDDVDTCQNLSDILTDLGYRVDSAHDGLSALEMVRKKPYDVALLDLKMPGMDGLEFYREIKRLGAGTVAMLVTAYASHATAEEALTAGAWQVLSKPVDFPKLLGYLDEALSQPLVLVVDDDRELCANLWELFRERGYRVALAHTANEAAGQVAHANYKVILIDMRIPGGDGGEVFRRVREANPQARTLLITDYRSETADLVARVLAEGADAVCYKPFDVPRLLDVLKELAGSRAEGRDENPGKTPR